MDTMPPTALAPFRSARMSDPVPALRRTAGALQRRAILTSAVQRDVIPCLLGRTAPRAASLAALVGTLADLSVGPDAAGATDLVLALLRDGVPAEAVLLDLLTPAARLLGERWADDSCSFADVSVGTAHLRAAMRAVRPVLLAGAPAMARPCRALLLPTPGEQHSFGCAMLADFFVRAGWDAEHDTLDLPALERTVAAEPFDLVGLSVSAEAMFPAAETAVAAIRRASRNPLVLVLVGGNAVAGIPAQARALGADGTAADGPSTVRLAERLLSPRPLRTAFR